MKILIMNEEETRQFVEAKMLGELRLRALSDSLEASNRQLDQARYNQAFSERLYHEALIQLAEDPDDDCATAREKAEKFEHIEEQFISAGGVYKRAIDKVCFDLAQCEKAGVSI